MSTRSFNLDLIRSAAIMLVLLSHASRFAPVSHSTQQYIAPAAGIVGVELFFALSGFLIGRILLNPVDFPDSGNLLFRFWFRRWMRTLPTYFLVLLSWLLLNKLIGGDNQLLSETASYFTFTQNFSAPHPEFFGVAWSLAVEEWSYLLVPILILLFSFSIETNPKKSLLICSLLLISISVLLRFQFAECHSSAGWDAGLRKIILFRFDAVAYGLIAALLSKSGVRISSFIPLMLMGCSAILYWLSGAVFNTLNFVTANLLPLTMGAGFSSFVLWINGRNFSASSFQVKIITQLSLCSYSLYLIHSPLWEFTLAVFPEGANSGIKCICFAAYISASIGAACFMYHFIEKPILILRDTISGTTQKLSS
jgi:peptidoglycan/LPS O-acetylase OafA/YrhL